MRSMSWWLLVAAACTPEAFTVDVTCEGDRATGDNDADGVCENVDQCPGTPVGVAVDGVGCPVVDDTDLPADTSDTDALGDTGDSGDAANRPPEVDAPTVGPTPAYNDSTLTCSATASDPDGTTPTVTYAWTNATTSASVGAGPERSLTPALATPGDVVTCTATASDGALTASDASDVTLSNRSPTISVPTIDPAVGVSVTSTLTCAATASDPDGTTPTVTYAWTNETRATTLGAGPQRVLTAGAVSAGDVVRCTATASDGGASESGTAEVTVGFAEPGPCTDPTVAGCSETNPRLGTLRYVPAGSFTMGCVVGRDDVAGGCGTDETPTRTVSLSTALWVMASELTQGMWSGLAFANPSTVVGSDRPVETVNWWEALEAANAASRADGLAECYTLFGCSGPVGFGRSCTGVAVTALSGHPKDCPGWRLPTEAEWEYTARAGTDLPFSGGDDVSQVAWYGGNNVPVGTKAVCTAVSPRNAWGLCDHSGNVWEWTWDVFASDYSGAPTSDPRGAAVGPSRAIRGGSYAAGEDDVRVARRLGLAPNIEDEFLGFRLVRSAP